MAITRAQLIASVSAGGFGTGQYNSASFTPPNNSLLLFVGYGIQTADGGMEGNELVPANSAGLSLTPAAQTNTSPAWSYGISAWTAPVVTGVSMTVGIDTDASNYSMEFYAIEVWAFTTDLGGGAFCELGATAIGSDADGDGAASITLSAAPATSSQVLGFCMTGLSSASGTITSGSGFTQVNEQVMASWAVCESEVRTGSTSTTVDWVDVMATGTTAGGSTLLAVEIRENAGSSTPTVSSPTPSGSLGTQFTATPGASTDQASGTGYVVVDTVGNITGISAAQVIAGQNNVSGSAFRSGNVAISASPFSVSISGLTPGTTYGYAVAQNNANGNSNVVTGSFTTAAAPPTMILGRRSSIFVTEEVLQG